MAATATIPVLAKHRAQVAERAAGSPGALLMGADYRALGVARSLGRHRIPVWMIKQGGHLVAATSRYVRRRVSWPEAEDAKRIDFLLDLSLKNGLQGWALIPTDDYAVTLASVHHDLLSKQYRVTVPRWEKLRWACDKRLLHELAGKLGIPQPWTRSVPTEEALANPACPFPVILKPAIRLKPNSLAIPKAWRADNQEALLAGFKEASALIPAENLIVQELIPGGGETQFSYAALCKDGLPLASVTARRLRQYPRDFGQFSTFVETVDEPQVVEPAERLLAATRFTGLVEVEFKKDPRSGHFQLLDVNPRVWGWHTLCARSGVDFSYLLWRLTRDEPVPRLQGRAGERWIHRSADLRVALAEILHGESSLASYLRSTRGPLESAIFSWDDPVPGFLDLPLFAYSLGERAIAPKDP
ncbi:MAG: ATP-grasp domain-containing protein [Acidobacteria bacterium]|nr:MAG: ATP-grasp domain-containing protein [Acidobacteriota bacterium]